MMELILLALLVCAFELWILYLDARASYRRIFKREEMVWAGCGHRVRSKAGLVPLRCGRCRRKS